MTTPILFLPGMMLSAGMWRPQLEALDGQGQLLVGDLSVSDTIQDMARHVLDSAPARFHLTGFSMGAIVALEIWRQASERIDRLALIGLNPRADPPERRPVRLAQVERALSGELEAMMHDSFLPNYFATSHKADPSLAAAVIKMAVDLGPQVFQRQIYAQLARPDSVPTLETITASTLIMCGAEDRITKPEQHERLQAAIPNATLKVIPDAGHMVALEQGATVAKHLGQFFWKA